MLALGNGVVTRVFSMSWLRWLGGISYGVYIFHVLLRVFYEKIPYLITSHPSYNVAVIITAVSSFILTPLVSWLSFRFFESPFLRLKHRFQAGPSIQ